MNYVPSPFEFFLLAAAAFRLTRLLAWDTFPPVVRARLWLLGEYQEEPRSLLLVELFACAFCLGFWVSLGLYLAWLWLPTVTLAASAVLGLSAVVGLVAKVLDP